MTSGASSSEAMDLRRKIQKLETENAKLVREAASAKQSGNLNDDRNWMSSFGSSGGQRIGTAGGGAIGGIDRPATASTQNARVREV